jgi:hypothetical protein
MYLTATCQWFIGSDKQGINTVTHLFEDDINLAMWCIWSSFIQLVQYCLVFNYIILKFPFKKYIEVIFMKITDIFFSTNQRKKWFCHTFFLLLRGKDSLFRIKCVCSFGEKLVVVKIRHCTAVSNFSFITNGAWRNHTFLNKIEEILKRNNLVWFLL